MIKSFQQLTFHWFWNKMSLCLFFFKPRSTKIWSLPTHSSLLCLLSPCLPSFTEHAKPIPDAGAMYSHSVYPGMVLPQISKQLASHLSIFTSKYNLRAVFPDLSTAKPSPHPIPLSYFLVTFWNNLVSLCIVYLPQLEVFMKALLFP